MSNIVLNTLTFAGEGFINGVSHFWNRLQGMAAGFRHLTNRVDFTADRVNVGWKLTVPVLIAEDSACGCTGELAFSPTIVDITVRFDKKAPEAHRADVDAMIGDLVASTQFSASVTTLAPQP